MLQLLFGHVVVGSVLQAHGTFHRHVGKYHRGRDVFPVPVRGDLHPVRLQLLDHIRRSEASIFLRTFTSYAAVTSIALNTFFAGSSSVPSMKTVSGLLFSLYRITLVDEYEYAAMVTVDDVMAPLLCGTFLAASSILCVNLLIALLTDTFQRSDIRIYITT